MPHVRGKAATVSQVDRHQRHRHLAFHLNSKLSKLSLFLWWQADEFPPQTTLIREWLLCLKSFPIGFGYITSHILNEKGHQVMCKSMRSKQPEISEDFWTVRFTQQGHRVPLNTTNSFTKVVFTIQMFTRTGLAHIAVSDFRYEVKNLLQKVGGHYHSSVLSYKLKVAHCWCP